LRCPSFYVIVGDAEKDLVATMSVTVTPATGALDSAGNAARIPLPNTVKDVGDLFAALGHLNHPVFWEALQAAIAATGDPLTEQERGELLLRAVNGEALPGPQWDRLIGVSLMEGLKTGKWVLPAARVEELRPSLTRIADDPGTAIDALGSLVSATNGWVLTVPLVSVQGRRWVVREHIVAYTLEAALAYALSLLLDPSKDLGRQLRYCKYPPCGRFQFAQPRTGPGHPATHYCGPEHEETHKRQLGKERKAAQRQGVTVEQYRKRIERAGKPASRSKK
jgi:hypothetical protein